MTVTLRGYRLDGTLLGVLPVLEAAWVHRPGARGAGQAVVDGATATIAEDMVIRIDVDGIVLPFGWWAPLKLRRKIEGSSDLDLSGPGLRAILAAAQIRQEDTSDCALPAEVRHFDPVSALYDIAGHDTPQSHGTVESSPFTTLRPTNAADVKADLIAPTTDPGAAGMWWAWAEFTVPETGMYAIQTGADDHYTAWLSGLELNRTVGEFQWELCQTITLPLCAGVTYRIAGLIGNLDRAAVGSNVTWFYCSVMPAAGDGLPAAANNLWHANTVADSGTFTLTVNGVPTGDLAWNITASNLQAALEALSTVGAGNVQVGGSGIPAYNHTVAVHVGTATGGTFTLTVNGQVTDPIAWNASAAAVEAAVEALAAVTSVTVTGTGTSADPWIIVFDGADAQTAFTVTGNGTALTPSDTLSVSTTQTGGPADPWTIEFIGDLALQPRVIVGDETGLDGGILTVSEVIAARSADWILHTDTTNWKVSQIGEDVGGLTPGRIVRAAKEEAEARGATPVGHFALGFTDTHDSAGQPWPQISLVVPIGNTTLEDLVDLLQESAFLFDIDVPNMRIDGWVDRGADLSATVDLTPWRDSDEQDASRVHNVLMVRTQESDREVPDATSVALRGRWEGGLLLTEYPTDAASQPAADDVVTDLSTPQEPGSYAIPSEAAGVQPYDDWDPHDLVTGTVFDEAGSADGPVRMVEVAGRIAEGSVDWTCRSTT